MNPPVKWIQTADDYWMFTDENGVRRGTAYLSQDGWCWEARVATSAKMNPGDPPLTGRATSLEGAKRIVETLLQETGTVTPQADEHNTGLSSSAVRLLDHVSEETVTQLLNEVLLSPGEVVHKADIEEALARLGRKGSENPEDDPGEE
jgi:hypothetical protein